MLILGREEKDIMMDSYTRSRVSECDSCSPNQCQNGGVCQVRRLSNSGVILNNFLPTLDVELKSKHTF